MTDTVRAGYARLRRLRVTKDYAWVLPQARRAGIIRIGRRRH